MTSAYFIFGHFSFIGQAMCWLMPINAVLLFRYWPYLSKVVEKSSDLQPLMKMRPFLSVMHAKAHTAKCEVPRITEIQMQQ